MLCYSKQNLGENENGYHWEEPGFFDANQMSGIEMIWCPAKGGSAIRALKLLEVDMGRQEHLSSFCLEGVNLPPLGLRCKCFNWCNSHQLTLVIGETPKLKRISFGSTKIHKLIHPLLIKCYHMLPLKFRNSGPFLPFNSIRCTIPIVTSPVMTASFWGPKHCHGGLCLLQQGLQSSAIAQHLSGWDFNGGFFCLKRFLA